MRKLYQTFQSPYSFHKPPYCFTVHPSILPQGVCDRILENLFFFLDLLLQEHFFHWFQLLSTKNNWNVLLFLTPITLRISQPFYHVWCWRRKKLPASMKTLLLLLTKSPIERNFFCPLSVLLSFFSFSFSAQLRPLPQICRVWLFFYQNLVQFTY